jgi:carbamate kinase
MFQNQLQNAFHRAGKDIPIATLITQVLVNKDDPDFQNPSKPVGPFYTKEEAEELRKKKGYLVKEVKPGSDKSWRRLVPSPEPIGIVESDVITQLLDSRVIVITSGGGGIPVIKVNDDEIRGIEAVVDKDRAGQKLAEIVGGNIFLVLTDVENAFINYGKPDQQALREINVSKLKKYLDDGHFGSGSMGPKIEACIKFIDAGGERAIITSLDKAIDAIKNKTGTHILPD